jgi:N-acetylmuramoyl-L-alanine amidase
MKSKRIQIIFTHILSIFLVTNFHAQGNGNIASAIKVVVIDPGHGGKDPGCLGANTQEKIVCLAMGLKLGELIKKKYPEIKVVYTRDSDVFVELDDRAKIANKNNADLFICIHANAASSSAVGTETYVLGLHRTESQQKIAERENAAIYLEKDKGEKYKDFDLSPDAIIARQIQLSVFLDQSISFATKLQKEFKGIGRYDRGVKQAGFIVLYKTTMPSVLIETGFLTNLVEQKFLMTEATQNLMSGSMFSAFEKYKNELEGINGQLTNKNEKNVISNDVEFKVQLETSEKSILLNEERFEGLEVSEYQQEKLFKYTSGVFLNDYKSANNHKNELRKQGFQHAFVVAFQNGERISLEKALKLAEK